MQVAPSGGQICNKCKWCHLVAKFGTNASCALWWPNLELMQVEPPLAGEITQVLDAIYTLGPLCLWQCFAKKLLLFAKKSTFFWQKKALFFAKKSTFFWQKKVLFFCKKKYFSSYGKFQEFNFQVSSDFRISHFQEIPKNW